MLEMKLTIHGRVQGVGYRYGILEAIEKAHIVVRGYIANRPNGTVEILVQGDIEALKDIRRFAANGNSNAYVRDIEESVQEISRFTYDSFSIEY